MGESRANLRSQREVIVVNEFGLHARPSAAIAAEAATHSSKISVSNGTKQAEAISISSLLMLEAHKGAVLTLRAEGVDSEQALEAIAKIISTGFGEDRLEIKGSGSECGLAMGIARIQIDSSIPYYHVAKSALSAEKRRLSSAIRKVRANIENLANNQDKEIKAFQTLLLKILEDRHINKLPKDLIASAQVNAEWALNSSVYSLVTEFQASEDELVRSRGDEYLHIEKSIIAQMDKPAFKKRRSHMAPKGILVAPVLGPAEVIELYRAEYKGFVTARGSSNSHAVILARGLGLPALVGIGSESYQQIKEEDFLIIDSDKSILIVNPDRETLNEQRRLLRLAENRKGSSTKNFFHQTGSTLTRDGERIALLANIDFPEEVPRALEAGAEGIGLFRTEHLFLERNNLPNENEQYAAYRKVLRKMGKKEVNFRTLDLGFDKTLGHLSPSASPISIRGVRYSLIETYQFKQQLRALIKVSELGNMTIMLPMIGSVSELCKVRSLLAEAQQEIGIYAPPIPPLGVMIEVPGSVWIMSAMAEHIDYFSIGTNDLIQYTLALDRNDDQVAHLADICHPGVLALIDQTVTQATKLGKKITMCGEAAADLRIARLFASRGLRSLSMVSNRLATVRAGLQETNLFKIATRAERVFAATTTTEVKSLLDTMKIN